MTRIFSSARQWLSAHAGARLVLLAAVVGLACMAVIPPWWHYDEPGHFEYAWLAAHSPDWPQTGQYNQDMRRQMAASMQRYNWYGIRNFKLDLKSPEPIPIGVAQIGDRPGYYFLASLPLRLMARADMTVQYSAVRLLSLGLLLLIVLAAWYALGEFLPAAHPLRWMATAFLATLPAFVDEMVSVNNDVGAVLAATLALWACLRLVRRGYSVGRLLFLAAALAACYLSKSTALFAFLLAPLALLLALLRGRYALYVWGALGLAIVLVAAVALTLSGARAWYATGGDGLVRTAQSRSPLGAHAFRLNDSAAGLPTQFLQLVPPEDLKTLRNRQDTFGFWLWADQPTQAGPVFVELDTRSGTVITSPLDALEATASPSWHQFTFEVPSDALSATIYIRQAARGLANNSVYVDGLVLAPGKFSAPPRFADASGARGTWDGHAFTNLVRNPSAEAGSLQLRRALEGRLAGALGSTGINPGATLTVLQDLRGTGWFYRGSIVTLFRTFWISLAGDKAPIPGSAITDLLLAFTLASVLGALLRLWRQRGLLPWDVIGLLALAFWLPWLLALVRGSADILAGNDFYPWARYAFPAILPTALLLCAGWQEWLERLARPLRLSGHTQRAVFHGFLWGLCFFALANAVRLFHPSWWDDGILLIVLLLFQAMFFYLYLRLTPRAESSPPGEA